MNTNRRCEECTTLARNLKLAQRRLQWLRSSHAILLGMFILVVAALIYSEVAR